MCSNRTHTVVVLLLLRSPAHPPLQFAIVRVGANAVIVAPRWLFGSRICCPVASLEMEFRAGMVAATM